MLCTALYNTTHTTLYYTTIYYIVLYCSVLQYSTITHKTLLFSIPHPSKNVLQYNIPPFSSAIPATTCQSSKKHKSTKGTPLKPGNLTGFVRGFVSKKQAISEFRQIFTDYDIVLYGTMKYYAVVYYTILYKNLTLVYYTILYWSIIYCTVY